MKNSLKQMYGSWGLVAGAAEGLGEANSTSLARRGMNLIMVDHIEKRLHDLASVLELEYGFTFFILNRILGRKVSAYLFNRTVDKMYKEKFN